MRNIKGFTLTELMIVIVIVGILSMWAIPKFFGATSKAKLSEFKLTLEHVASQQEVYLQEHDAYAKTFDDLAFEAPKSKYFDYTMKADSSGFVASATVKVNVKGVGKKNMKGMSVSINQDDVHGGDEALRKLVNW